jgi:AraC-like DNA-binding protein
MNEPNYDMLLSTLKIGHLMPSNVLLQLHHNAVTYIKRTLPAINQYVDGRVCFQNKSQAKQMVEAGGGILIMPDMLYRSENLNPDSTRRLGISFRFAVMGGIDPLSLLETPFVLDRKTGDYIGELNQALFAIDSRMNFIEKTARRAELGMRLFLKIATISRLKPDAMLKLSSYQIIQPVLDYVHENYQQQIDVASLARIANLSKSRFYKVFRDLTNTSPNQYILHYRLRKAQELLLGDLRIYQIAEQSGFDDQYYFSRIFKQKFGLTPYQFRQQNKTIFTQI